MGNFLQPNCSALGSISFLRGSHTTEKIELATSSTFSFPHFPFSLFGPLKWNNLEEEGLRNEACEEEGRSEDGAFGIEARRELLRMIDSSEMVEGIGSRFSKHVTLLGRQSGLRLDKYIVYLIALDHDTVHISTGCLLAFGENSFSLALFLLCVR